MAEFLIMAKKHWAEDVDKTGWSQEKIDKMARQYRIGDIVEVRENGYWSNIHGWDHQAFALLIVPTLSLNDTKHLMERADILDSDNKIISQGKKRRYAINVANVSINPGDIKTVNATLFSSALIDKNN